ncbi:hypothetical protein ACTFIU_002427 [Dictyostelium citrinum]
MTQPNLKTTQSNFSKSGFPDWPSNKKPKMSVCEMKAIYSNIKWVNKIKSIHDYKELVDLFVGEDKDEETIIQEFIAYVTFLEIDNNNRLKSLEQKYDRLEFKFENFSDTSKRNEELLKQPSLLCSSQLTTNKLKLQTTKLISQTSIQSQSSITKNDQNKIICLEKIIKELEEKMAKEEKDFLDTSKRNEELLKTNEKLNSQINELEKKLNELQRKSENDLKTEREKFSIVKKKNTDLLKELNDKKQNEIIQPTDCNTPSSSSSSSSSFSSSIPSSPSSNNFEILSIDPTISQPHHQIKKKLQLILPPQPNIPSFTVYLTDNSLLENMNELFQQALNDCVVEKLPPQPINFKKNSLILFVKNIGGYRADVDVDLETMQNLIVTYGVVKDSITDQYPVIYTAFIIGKSSNNVIPNSIFKSVLINYSSRNGFDKNKNRSAIQTIQSFIKIDQNK